MGSLAAQIMQIRQTETPVSKVLDTFAKQDAPAEIKALIRSLVLTAYEQPAMMTEKNKQNQVDRYRNEVEMQCYRAGSD